jgi:hypothetical protein
MLMSLVEELEGAQALVRDRHFVYTHGQHGPDYVRIDALFSRENEELLYRVCGELALPFKDSGIEAVTACDEDRCSGLANFTAEHLGVKASSGKQLRGLSTLIAEDVLTTGEGVVQIRRKAQFHGAVIVGASVIVNRGGVTKEQLGVPRLESLAVVPLLAMEPDQCGLCVDNLPIVADVGKGNIFRLHNPDYSGGYQDMLAL